MSRTGLSHRFTRAIVREPSRSVINGLRADDRGAPSHEQFVLDHHAYVAALEQAGVTVDVYPALEDFPDSVFVEDAALCFPEGAVILRPGAPSRTGEAKIMNKVLLSYYEDIQRIGEDEGYVDGGDILVTEDAVLVGLSARTNQTGFDALKQKIAKWGYEARAINTPEGVLHFKTDCGLIGPNAVLATYRLSGSPCFAGMTVLEVPRGEEPAANAICVNDTVLLSAGHPKTAELLRNAGYNVVEIPTQQAALVDGGPSCMSLRFNPVPFNPD
ncbi:arginine deiminase family protein [Kiloniella laminariae]|uniref:Arginine deiminase family protein n=1 Tax=Kiloniella laminariae TaxID=454162 RepID=A0ABT4LIX3_9PROT|nr:arginine deiminase family protein [Kiloniella laminariae]MCZ4281054.1 arginine deiminase family protein [Kiloniella laminariae]